MKFKFIRNSIRRDTYDLESGPSDINLLWIKLSNPIKKFLTKNGATYVIESWKENEKILFSGLIPISNNRYKGNHWSMKQGTLTEFIMTIPEDLSYMVMEVISQKKKGPNS